MSIRSVEEWKEVFRLMADDLAATVGAKVLGDLTHYRHGLSYEDDDRHTLGNALLAWGQLEREWGVKT